MIYNYKVMHDKEKFLVVISVLQGRKFPQRKDAKIVIEAKFDGELLTTDPTEHIEAPDFTQELAWELDKKSLHQHRLQRSSIKLQVFAVNGDGSGKENVGFVVLDLRSATDKLAPKWYPLLHNKYSKNKPEMRLSMYIDEDKGPDADQQKEKDRTATKDTLAARFDPKCIKPVLNEKEGHYQIGAVKTCCDFFKLSITIERAANLPQLIPIATRLQANGYFFYYSVFDNDVTNEPFFDLINPEFEPERATIKIRSDTEILRSYLNQLPPIQVHLCCGNKSLGSCEVSLKDLLKLDSNFVKPVAVEKSFVLQPPNKVKPALSPAIDDLQPIVDLSVMLNKDPVSSPSLPNDDTPVNSGSNKTLSTSPPGTPIASKQPRTTSTPPPIRDSSPTRVLLTPPEKLQKSPAFAALRQVNGTYTDTEERGQGDAAKNARVDEDDSPSVAETEEDPRETLEYKKAVELELWLEDRKETFEKELRLKEQRHVKTLTEEFMKRNTEREVMHRKKMQEVQKLEEKLGKTLDNLEKREKQLAANEHELQRLKKDQHREYENKQRELQEASRRMKEDCDHKVHLEKDKNKEYEEQIKRLKGFLTEQEGRYKALEKEFSMYREHQGTKPEVRLQAEINMLTLEKVELERKLEATQKSKLHYKQQWGKALKELAKIRQREQEAAKSDLRKREMELEHMRLQYLAAEEKKVANNEKKEIEDLKHELQILSSRLETPHTDASARDDPVNQFSSYDEEHIARLIEEKNGLLRTGVYSTNDKVIAELERQIKEAMERKEACDVMNKIVNRRYKD